MVVYFEYLYIITMLYKGSAINGLKIATITLKLIM